jgi:hypothetical protein
MFLGIGVVVVLLLFLSLIPVREGAITKSKLGTSLSKFNTKILETERIANSVTPVSSNKKVAAVKSKK